MAGLQRAVFVEFDNAVLHGIKDYVQAANSFLEPLGIPIDAIAYARFFSGRNRNTVIAALLKKAEIDHEAAPLSNGIIDFYKETLLKRAASAAKICKSFAAPLLQKNINVVFASQLPEEQLQEVLGDALGEGIHLWNEPTQFTGGYGWENWRRLCRRLDLHERLCGAVVGSGLSAKGALATGLSVTACPDPLSVNQDFGGVDAYFDKLDATVADEMLRLLWQK